MATDKLFMFIFIGIPVRLCFIVYCTNRITVYQNIFETKWDDIYYTRVAIAIVIVLDLNDSVRIHKVEFGVPLKNWQLMFIYTVKVS